MAKRETIRQQFEKQRERQAALKRKQREETARLTEKFARREEDLLKSIASQADIAPMVTEKDAKAILAAHEEFHREQTIERRRLWTKQAADTVATLRREKNLFDIALAKYLKWGFQDAYALRSSIHFKLATEWEENASPDAGPEPRDFERPDEPLARARAGFDVIEDPVFGSFVNRLHPFALVDVGTTTTGEIEASVRPVLTFQHDPPERNVWCNGLSLGISLSGYCCADSSDAIFPQQSLAMGARADASLTMSIRVMQQVVSRGVSEDFEFPIVSNEHLMSVSSLGAYWIIPFTPIVIDLSDGYRSQELSYLANGNNQFGPWVEYPLQCIFYGAGQFPGSIYQGGPIRIEIEFNLRAEARYRNAMAAVHFDGPGLGIHIREIVLHTR